MTQPLSRRNFLRKGTLAAGAAVILSPALRAGTAGTTAPNGDFAIDRTDRTALNFLSQFSTDAIYTGGGVAARQAGEIPATTHIAARLTDFSALRAALGTPKRSGISKVHISGNQLTFSAEARKFVTLLSHGTDAALPATKVEPSSFRFAHQALEFRITTNELFNPFQAGRSLSLLHDNSEPVAAFNDLIDGLVEAKAFGLIKGAGFDLWKTRTLSRDGSASAFGLVTGFSKNLSILVDAVSREEMNDLLSSNLLNSAFAAHAGHLLQPAIWRFETLRLQAGSTYSDAAVWMACIFEPQIQEGTVGRLLNPDNHLRQLATREAIKQAIQLLV